MKIQRICGLLSLTLTLASCNSVTFRPPAQALHSLENQTIQTWPTEASVEGTILLADWLEHAQVYALGQFSLDLPQKVNASLLTTPAFNPPAGCTSTVTLSDAAVKWLTPSVKVRVGWLPDPISLSAASHQQLPVGGNAYTLVYSSSQVYVVGEQTCNAEAGVPFQKNHYQMDVQPGWNVLQMHVDSSTEATYTSTTEVPADLRWWPDRPVPDPGNQLSLENERVLNWVIGSGASLHFNVRSSLWSVENTLTPLQETPIMDGTGDFGLTLHLPRPEQLGPLSQMGDRCERKLNNSHPEVQVGVLDPLVLDASGKVVHRLILGSYVPTQAPENGSHRFVLIYASGDTTLKGQVKCDAQVLDLDVTLVKGWNVLVGTYTDVQTRSMGFTASQTIPGHFEWWLTDVSTPLL